MFSLNQQFFLHLFGFILCFNYVCCLPATLKPILMVVSYDGFGNYYFELNITKYMQKFREEGVYAPYVRNVFPTKTFTNHFTIATGLYPGTHGVTANSVYDSKLGYLSYGYDLFHYKEDVLPIWIVNELNGGISGCMMWPGSDFEYSNVTCTHTYIYNTSVPLKEKVDIVMEWLTHPEKPANLIMLYYDEPDKTGHMYGPNSKQTLNRVKEVNDLTKYIEDKLNEYKLHDRTNIMHLSDHGMIGVSPPSFIDLKQFLENETYSMYGTSPILQIVPVEGKENDVYERLKKAAARLRNFEIYNNDDLLKRWQCKNQRRFGPITAVANLGYAFQDMYERVDNYWKEYKIPFTPESVYGVHGYDNAFPSMTSYFMAKGPLLKRNHVVEPFNNVDLFNLFCKVLNIKNPPKTEGNFARVMDLLEVKNNTTWIVGVIAGLCVFVSITFIGVAVYNKKFHSDHIIVAGQKFEGTTEERSLISSGSSSESLGL